MDQNKKTPQVRFKGYTDTWEQRKLGEVAPLRVDMHLKVMNTKQKEHRL